MTKEQRDAALRLVDQYARLVSENLAMQALLEVVQSHGAFRNFAGPGTDSSWQTERDYLIRNQLKDRIESDVAQVRTLIEQAFQDAEFSRLLSAYPQKGPVN
jgi:hypothetical protein